MLSAQMAEISIDVHNVKSYRLTILPFFILEKACVAVLPHLIILY